jgi:hypothetical protein
MQALVLEKEKKKSRKLTLRLGLNSAQRGGQGGGSRAGSWRGGPGRPGGGCLLLLGWRSWASAFWVRPNSQEAGRGRAGAQPPVVHIPAGGPLARFWWTRSTPSSLSLRLAVRQVQPGSGGAPPPVLPFLHGSQGARSAPAALRWPFSPACAPFLLVARAHVAFSGKAKALE